MARFRTLRTSPLKPNGTVARVAVQDWVAFPTLQNSWTAYSSEETPGYWLDPWGVVHLRGALVAGTLTTGTLLATFPLGYRPLGNESFAAPSVSAATVSVVRLAADGTFKIIAGAATTAMALNGITWRANTA